MDVPKYKSALFRIIFLPFNLVFLGLPLLHMQWFDKDDGIHGDVESHLRCTCRHKYLHRPPDEESDLWNISFPATEECNDIMDRK